LFCSARCTASFTVSGSGSAVGVPFGTLPKNGPWVIVRAV